jgi:hypothetical protein
MTPWRSYTLRALDPVQRALCAAIGSRCSVCQKVEPTHEASYAYQRAGGAPGVGYRLVCEGCGQALVGGGKRHG